MSRSVSCRLKRRKRLPPIDQESGRKAEHGVGWDGWVIPFIKKNAISDWVGKFGVFGEVGMLHNKNANVRTT
ncbi:hypothetical protein [Dapis sp. BLCC M229]|uniref:hypothetical protein n=1 Tax=Dapis sp. BLCC M229 TaxID=3400188 RepID=UPI003CEEA18E